MDSDDEVRTRPLPQPEYLHRPPVESFFQLVDSDTESLPSLTSGNSDSTSDFEWEPEEHAAFHAQFYRMPNCTFSSIDATEPPSSSSESDMSSISEEDFLVIGTHELVDEQLDEWEHRQCLQMALFHHMQDACVLRALDKMLTLPITTIEFVPTCDALWQDTIYRTAVQAEYYRKHKSIPALSDTQAALLEGLRCTQECVAEQKWPVDLHYRDDLTADPLPLLYGEEQSQFRILGNTFNKYGRVAIHDSVSRLLQFRFCEHNVILHLLHRGFLDSAASLDNDNDEQEHCLDDPSDLQPIVRTYVFGYQMHTIILTVKGSMMNDGLARQLTYPASDLDDMVVFKSTSLTVYTAVWSFA
ncbi:hypothetical protein C8J57DRAFT_1491382 [Mycena rebaudengoi]|nr:hypothetical protein C8J57DRAFT_1491382 [Mycena rebaudengoi]